jgi:hypothetical protein
VVENPHHHSLFCFMFHAIAEAWSTWRLRNERLLFRFHDGRQTRAVDPFKVWRELRNHPTFDFQSKLPLVDKGLEPATTDCVNALCDIFGVERWNEAWERGLTDWEILNLLDYHAQFLDTLKKNINGGPISSPPTDSASSISPAAPGEPTSSSEHFGSTSSGAS